MGRSATREVSSGEKVRSSAHPLAWRDEGTNEKHVKEIASADQVCQNQGLRRAPTISNLRKQDRTMSAIQRWVPRSLVSALAFVALLGVPDHSRGQPPAPPEPVRYFGMCDASAAVAVGEDAFIVADDEQNTFKIYPAATSGPALGSFPWGQHLGTDLDGKPQEADIEGATRLGETVFWITSHGRNLNGKWRPSRHQLFAMRMGRQDAGWVLNPVGKPYHELAKDLVSHPPLRELGLAEALGTPEIKDGELAPKTDGFNIEGLSVMADGKSLLIGFRNPLPNEQALLVPLLNPMDVVLQSAAPQFGTPILLRLHVRYQQQEHQLGIRSIEYSRRHGGYLIAAGRPDSQDVFALYFWSGNPSDRPRVVLPATATILKQADFAPEALVVYEHISDIQLLSDDGTTVVPVQSRKECEKGAFKNGMCEQKFLLDDARKSFGALLLPVE